MAFFLKREADAGQNAEILAQLRLVAGQSRDRLALVRRQRTHLVVKVRDRQRAVAPVEPGQQDIQGQGRVGQGTAGHAAVDRQSAALDLDLHGDDAAQRIGDARQADLDVLGVADDDHVGLQAFLMLAEEAQQVLRADLFLALDEHLDVDGQLALASSDRRRRRRAGR